MTAGFEVNDPAGTAAVLPPPQAWARTLRSEPGTAFAYDNSIIPLVMAALESASGKPLPVYAGDQLVQPLGMAAPSFERGLRMRTIDMAKLGHLFLAGGQWDGKALLPAGFAADTTRMQNKGGPPAQMPYGMFWWTPSASTYFASGYAGQLIWVHPPLGMVVAIHSTVSQGSQQRGQALQLIRGHLFQAAQARLAAGR
jgi:CubicO group peptidase (beta-lactamase class C family)